MNKNLIALMLFALMAFSSIANAAGVKSGTTQVSANFAVISQCSVTGTWDTIPLPAGRYDPVGATLGYLRVDISGCNGGKHLYIEGANKDANGRLLATAPDGSQIAVKPGGSWVLESSDGLYYSLVVTPDTGNGTQNLRLTNDDYWDAIPGTYHMAVMIGLYSI
ncbi:TPA: hypothetical protein ACS7WR_003701 [Providencia alcalifaciens]